VVKQCQVAVAGQDWEAGVQGIGGDEKWRGDERKRGHDEAIEVVGRYVCIFVINSSSFSYDTCISIDYPPDILLRQATVLA
jgi:hypothetical protein